MFNIVLVEPQIPPNTGNIARLCAATNSTLYLIGKLGFSLEDKYLKRAGLDYWNQVKIIHLPTLEDLCSKGENPNFFYLSTKVKKLYTEVNYKKNDFLVFGKETKGLPEDLLKNNPATAVTIPMYNNKVRSLNLATSVGIVLYEAIRQLKPNLQIANATYNL